MHLLLFGCTLHTHCSPHLTDSPLWDPASGKSLNTSSEHFLSLISFNTFQAILLRCKRCKVFMHTHLLHHLCPRITFQNHLLSLQTDLVSASSTCSLVLSMLFFVLLCFYFEAGLPVNDEKHAPSFPFSSKDTTAHHSPQDDQAPLTVIACTVKNCITQMMI